MSFIFLSARILMTVRAGLALNICSSPVKGLTPLRAGTAFFFTVVILNRPGSVNVPGPFLPMCFLISVGELFEHRRSLLARDAGALGHLGQNLALAHRLGDCASTLPWVVSLCKLFRTARTHRARPRGRASSGTGSAATHARSTHHVQRFPGRRNDRGARQVASESSAESLKTSKKHTRGGSKSLFLRVFARVSQIARPTRAELHAVHRRARGVTPGCARKHARSQNRPCASRIRGSRMEEAAHPFR